jgi:Flp pilus assembly protein TadD
MAHNNLGALYDKLKRDEEAEREFRESIRIKPNDLINHYNLAVFFGKRDKLHEAKNEYMEMLKLDPKCMPAYSGFFSLLMKRKESKKEDLRQVYLEAEKLFAEGIVRFSDNANMHSYLGYVQLHLRKFKEAEREFNVALRLDQRNQLAHVFLALKQKGEWEKIGVAD